MQEFLEYLGIQSVAFPEVKPSSALFGYTDAGNVGAEVPVSGDCGDQQSALFGQACFEDGMSKMTYGTAGVFDVCSGTQVVDLEGLTASCFAGVNDTVLYEVEGVLFFVGAAVQWLRDGLKIIRDSADTEKMARSVDDNGGVYFVPAMVGLCAPYWDSYARGTIVGLTPSATEAHLVRATLESMAYQTRDVFDRYVKASGKEITMLRADGGAV